MDNIPRSYDAAVTAIYTEEMITSFRERLREAEALANELNDVLANCAADPGIIGTPQHWVRDYREGLRTAEKVFRNGMLSLESFEDRVHPKRKGSNGQSVRALERFENEGGFVYKEGGVRMKDLTNAA